jgi:hypothetical protein
MRKRTRVPISSVSSRLDKDPRVHFDLSSAEFLSLLRIVSMGETMANGYRIDDRIPEYMDIDQIILKLAAREGFHDLVDFDEESRKYFLSRKLDEMVSDLIDDFEEMSLWEEMAYRLASRDMAREFGEKGVKKLPLKKFSAELFSRADRYASEFEEHGVDRLEIIGPPSGRTGS